jgi:asparagine synthase (glutamine-hydrolysing)
MFDVLRSDKSISSHGLEPRTPFLDRSWVQYYMTIHPSLRFHKVSKTIEKSLLRMAFSETKYKNSQGLPLLPLEVLMRKKEAFSDGVSKTTRSLYQIIQEYTETKFLEEDYSNHSFNPLCSTVYEKTTRIHDSMKGVDDYLLPKTSEQFYYRKIFEKHYSGMGKILPYFWMPKYVNATDASARTLDIYSNSKET